MRVLLILFIILIVLGYGFSWWAKRALRRSMASMAAAFRDSTQGEGQGDTPAHDHEPLVQCSHCHTFIPRSHAIATKSGYYHCPEHNDDNMLNGGNT
jgi:hypothetical protein